MSFKVFEQDGNWAVVRDSPGLSIAGGEPISYELYQQLKDKPHNAADHFDRVNGKIIAKSKPKEVK